MGEESPRDDAYEKIRELRAEAKQHRLEAQSLKAEVESIRSEFKLTKVENELVKRGVKADPSWVKVDDGQSTAEAVDSFVEQYPHLVGVESGSTKPEGGKTPSPLPRESNNSPLQVSSAALKGRDVEEIAQDPKARRHVSDIYRNLLYGDQE